LLNIENPIANENNKMPESRQQHVASVVGNMQHLCSSNMCAY